MKPDLTARRNVIDLAVQGLQEERSACVRRLEHVLADATLALEAQAYLKRIENINAALVRLAGSHVVA